MHSVTVEQMREADRRAIDVLGIPGVVLMDRAGFAVFDRIPRGAVVVVCGKGNNGGDGFVVARYCLLAGYDVSVVVLARVEDVTQDARLFQTVYTRLGGRCIVADSEDCVRRVFESQNLQATWIDAMLGTGTKGEVRGPIRTAIETWPTVRTIAVDIPSGLDGDTGKPCGAAVKATETVTFQYAKAGFDSELASTYTGEVHVADIGIPSVCVDDLAWADLDLEQ